MLTSFLYNIFDYKLPKGNYSALVDPTANDDISEGYRRGSRWLNSVSGEVWECVDSTDGEAVWVQTSFEPGDVATIALSGNLSDAADLGAISANQVLKRTAGGWEGQTLASVAISGDYTDLIGAPSLADVATSGDYTDLINTPTLAAVATSGDYNDLINTPSLATVASTGDYSNLINVPATLSGSTVDFGSKVLIGVATLNGHSFPSGTSTFVTTGGSQTLTDKYLENPTVSGVLYTPSIEYAGELSISATLGIDFDNTDLTGIASASMGNTLFDESQIDASDNGFSISAAGGLDLDSSGLISLDGATGIELGYNGTNHLQIYEDLVELVGADFSVSSPSDINFAVGGSEVNIDSSGVDIKGDLKLNGDLINDAAKAFDIYAGSVGSARNLRVYLYDGSANKRVLNLVTPGTGLSDTAFNWLGGSANFSASITASKFFVSSINSGPTGPTDTGTAGEIRFALNYIYVCVATNTWKRVAISTW